MPLMMRLLGRGEPTPKAPPTTIFVPSTATAPTNKRGRRRSSSSSSIASVSSSARCSTVAPSSPCSPSSGSYYHDYMAAPSSTKLRPIFPWEEDEDDKPITARVSKLSVKNSIAAPPEVTVRPRVSKLSVLNSMATPPEATARPSVKTITSSSMMLPPASHHQRRATTTTKCQKTHPWMSRMAVLFIVTLSVCATALMDSGATGKQRGKYLPAKDDTDSLGKDMYEAYKELKDDYHSKAIVATNQHQWRVLKERDGAKVSLLQHDQDPTCPYVKMETTIPTSVADCWDFLQIHNWHWSMPKMDPFYDSHSVHANHTTPTGVNMILVHKKTHRIVTFGKRDFVFLSVSDVPLPDGTFVSGSVSVETPDVPRSPKYTRAFQDSIAFYKPLANDKCHITIVCRIDLNDSGMEGKGGFIPMWLYVKTVGATGIASVLKMKNALIEMKKQHRQSEAQAAATAIAPSSTASIPPTPSPVMTNVQKKLQTTTTPTTASEEEAHEEDSQSWWASKATPFSESSTSSSENMFQCQATTSPTQSSWWHKPRGGAFLSSMTSSAAGVPKEETKVSTSKWWQKLPARGGGTGTGTAFTNSPPVVKGRMQHRRHRGGDDDGWKRPLYQVFTHYSPPTSNSNSDKKDEHHMTNLHQWLHRVPLLGKHFLSKG